MASTCLCKVQSDLILEIDPVYYAACYRFPSTFPSDLKIHAQKSASVSVSVQKIGEGRGNTRNSIPDVEMNNLPFVLSLPALHASLFSIEFYETFPTPNAANDEK